MIIIQPTLRFSLKGILCDDADNDMSSLNTEEDDGILSSANGKLLAVLPLNSAQIFMLPSY